MEKQDWLNKFEATHGRSPEAHEVEAALQAGEFVERVESSQEPVVSEEVVKAVETEPAPETEEAIIFEQEPGGPKKSQLEQLQSNPHFIQAKEKGLNYLKWLLVALKNPVARAEEGHFTHAIITVGLAALFMGGAVVNYLGRVIGSMANMTVSGISLAEDQPEFYRGVSRALSSEFGLLTILQVAILVLVIYLVAILLPAIFNLLVGKEKRFNLMEEIGKAGQFLPILLVLNLVGFLSTFIVPSKLVIPDELTNQMGSLYPSFFSGNPAGLLASYPSLLQEIPAVKVYGAIFTVLAIVSAVGFSALVVALVNNLRLSFKFINKFYLNLISVLVLVLVIYLVDGMIANILLENLKNLTETVSRLF